MRGRQRTEDQIDVWCNTWARQRRFYLGITQLQTRAPAHFLVIRIRKAVREITRIEKELRVNPTEELHQELQESQTEHLTAMTILERLDNTAGLTPQERLGQLRCTLAKIRTEREGASYTKASQQFPEVYTGMALEIHMGHIKLPGEQRMVMHLQYVWREVPVADKAPTIALSTADYWRAVDNVKSFLSGRMSFGTYPTLPHGGVASSVVVKTRISVG